MARLAHCLEELRSQVDALAPGRDKSSDGWIAGEAHHAQNPTSDHEADAAGIVHALDITIDASHGVTHELAEQIRVSRDPRIKYIISNRRISNPDIQDWAWRPYTKKNPHTLHFHVSVKSDPNLENDQRPWSVTLAAPTGEVSVARPRLKQGDKGPAVSEAQKLLGVPVDGVFGTGTDGAVRIYQSTHGMTADGIIGPYTWEALLRGDAPHTVPVAGRQMGITATVFSSREKNVKGAYGDWLEPTMDYVALPALVARGTLVRVIGPLGAKVAPVLDKGPHYDGTPERPGDPYWLTGDRPRAESDPRTNGAGIDLSPALAKAIGIDGKGTLDWEFVGPAPVAPDPVPLDPDVAGGFPVPLPPFPIPGWPAPQQPAPPNGQTFNLPIGDLFGVISRLPRLAGLINQLPRNLTIDDYTAALEDGLTRLVHGPGTIATPATSPRSPLPKPMPKGVPSMIINWQTTGTGVATILTGLAALITMFSKGSFDGTVLSTAIGSITAGFGLIFAKDKNVTGGTVQQ